MCITSCDIIIFSYMVLVLGFTFHFIRMLSKKDSAKASRIKANPLHDIDRISKIYFQRNNFLFSLQQVQFQFLLWHVSHHLPLSMSQYLPKFASSIKISRPFPYFGMLILSIWISLTRISDYFHHLLIFRKCFVRGATKNCQILGTRGMSTCPCY